MTEREKLVDLLAQRCEFGSKGCVGCKTNCPGAADCKQEKFAPVADYLLSNGVTVHEWISTKDRLPENETIVLCWRGRRWCEPEICTYGDLKGEKCFYYIDDCGFRMKCLRPSITHWMPLPEPPKEE